MPGHIPFDILDLISLSVGHATDRALEASSATAELVRWPGLPATGANGMPRITTPRCWVQRAARLIARVAEHTRRIPLCSDGFMQPDFFLRIGRRQPGECSSAIAGLFRDNRSRRVDHDYLYLYLRPGQPPALDALGDQTWFKPNPDFPMEIPA